MNKLLRWIGDGLRKCYPVAGAGGDPLGAIARSAVARHEEARAANALAAHENMKVMRAWIDARNVDPARTRPYN